MTPLRNCPFQKLYLILLSLTQSRAVEVSGRLDHSRPHNWRLVAKTFFVQAPITPEITDNCSFPASNTKLYYIIINGLSKKTDDQQNTNQREILKR